VGCEGIVGVTQAVDDEDPQQDPIFFLSYAHGPRLDLVQKFYATLSEHIQQLFGLSADLVGFMDTTSLQAGARWTPTLMTALGTCHVFVPLISLAYVRSEWCAREWHAFHRRAVHTAKPGLDTTPVLPVLWSTLPRAETPQAISSLQLFLPDPQEPGDLRRQYRRNGMYGLGVTQHDHRFDTLVWLIAQEIWRIDAEHRVEPGIVRNPLRLPSSLWGDHERAS
jgi:hypothetical protein